MKWIKELPTEDGTYWMKHKDDENCYADPVTIDTDTNYVYTIGNDVPLGMYDDDFDEKLFSDQKIICNVN